MPSSTRPGLGLLPFVAAQPLVDHHCHGVLGGGGGALTDADLEGLLNEADGDAARGMAFDSLAGLAFRRWCPPLLDLPAHAPLAAYQARRAELGADEVNRRFLGFSGLAALLVDTGYTPTALLSPARTAAFAGATAFGVVRLEQLAESVARAGGDAAGFPDAYRGALAARVITAAAGVPAVAVKSIAAYRVGLALAGTRPSDAEVVAAVSRWLSGGAAWPGSRAEADGRDSRGGDWVVPRLADEVLHRFFVWCGADLGLPVQFHVGYGDRDVDLRQCDPLLLTDLLRALEPTGVPVMLLHNYPFHREAGYLAQVFPHVYADLGLATHNVGSRAAAVLAEALELVPLRKFLFSSDAFGLAELYYLGTLLFRRALSAFLTAGLDADELSYADAERITGLIGAENARRAYRLDG